MDPVIIMLYYIYRRRWIGLNLSSCKISSLTCPPVSTKPARPAERIAYLESGHACSSACSCDCPSNYNERKVSYTPFRTLSANLVPSHCSFAKARLPPLSVQIATARGGVELALLNSPSRLSNGSDPRYQLPKSERVAWNHSFPCNRVEHASQLSGSSRLNGRDIIEQRALADELHAVDLDHTFVLFSVQYHSHHRYGCSRVQPASQHGGMSSNPEREPNGRSLYADGGPVTSKWSTHLEPNSNPCGILRKSLAPTQVK